MAGSAKTKGRVAAAAGPRAAVGAVDSRVAVAAGGLVVALACALVLAMALFGHPVGDYHAESDFYGGYAAGARLIEHGHVDPARYPVVGPLYEFALALFGLPFADLFLAAKLLSALAACATLALWYELLRRRAGAFAALWGVALLASNAVFLRYGYSASTDMLALFLVSAALFALAAMRSSRAPLVAGACVALAALTRYSAVVLVPAGVLALWLAPRGAGGGADAPGATKTRGTSDAPGASAARGVTAARGARPSRSAAIARFVGAFALVAAPWVIYACASGHVPGEPLVRYFSFYANPASDRSVQDLGPAAADSARAYRSLGEMLRRDPGGLLRGVLANLPGHLALDARDLLGWPVALLAAFGAVVALLWRRRVALAPLWLAGALQFLVFAPVFHSERYALPLVPIELCLAALALAWPRAWIGALVGVAVVAYSAVASVGYQGAVRGQLPTEVVAAGRALRAVATPESRVLSRKGHVGFYSGVPVTALPRLSSLAELGDYARASRSDFLYYSWYEAQLRPEFAYLLDTSSAVPGLSVVHVSERKPSVLYRIGPEFGAPPAWATDAYEKQLHLARALVDVLPESLVWSYRITLAVDALQRERPDVALRLADDAIRVRAAEPLAWEVRGHALQRMGRRDEAIEAYRRSVALAPGQVETQVWLGWALLRAGREDEAADVWRPTLASTHNADAAKAMHELYARRGDAPALAELSRRGW